MLRKLEENRWNMTKAAQALGCTRVTLLTDGVNTSAIRFYERLGFARSEMVPFRLHFPAP